MKPTLTFLFLLISALTYSQINYEQGYFVTNNGTRTECLIRNVAWKNSPVDFEYRATESGETKKATIKEVSEFGVGSYKFRRYTVNIDRSSSLVEQLSTKKEPEWIKETLFLKALVEGKATLYQYEDSNLVRYFYSTGDHSAAEQLLFKEYRQGSIIVKNNQYKQELYNLMKDKLNEHKKFESLSYKKDPLVKLFVEYNGTSGEKVQNLSEGHNKGKINLKITPGIGLTSLSLENVSLPQRGAEFDSKISYRVGLELEYILPFNNSKWSLFVDPNYQTYENTAENGPYKWKIKYNKIEVPVGARHYFFLNDDSKIFVNASYVFDFRLEGSGVQLLNREPLEIVKTGHVAAGAGFSYNRFSLEARYNFRHSLFDMPNWPTDYKTINFILGIRIL